MVASHGHQQKGLLDLVGFRVLKIQIIQLNPTESKSPFCWWDQCQAFLNSQGKVLGKVIKLRSAIRPVIQLAAQVDSPQGCEVYELAREMTKRHASKPVDKLSGLFYLLHTTKLPCYGKKMTSEGFWKQCFHLLPVEQKAEILFDFLYRGSDKQWFPTWAQVLDWPSRNQE